MITPHLPPEQAANALLPVMLAGELARSGVSTRFVSHLASPRTPDPHDVRAVYVPRRGRGTFNRSKVGALVAAVRMAAGAAQSVRESDLIHLHGNGLVVEVGQTLARRYRKPYVVTLYGTDVWDHNPAAHARFGRVARGAACRVFYSRGLLEFAKPLDLAPEPAIVIYAPVSSTFSRPTEDQRQAIRRELGVDSEPVLVTVKRLHPVAGHETLLRALPQVLRTYPDAKVWIVGEGGQRSALEAQTRELGLASQVRFFGRVNHESISRYYAAADLFVLPSHLESWGTVMLEALACGTPVVSTSTAGGLEVRDHFPDDVAIVDRRDAPALAAAVTHALSTRTRASAAAAQKLRERFDAGHCAERYLAVYREALGVSLAG